MLADGWGINMDKRLLITGFDPFGELKENPSWMAVCQLPDKIGCFALHKLLIPTSYGDGAKAVLDAAASIKPDLILCIGVAAGRSAVTPERIGVNIRDARIPDNAGNQPRGQYVVPGAPAAYFATVPVDQIAESVAASGIPATVSNSAGAFVCNDVLFTLLHHFHGTSTKVGFIHIPALPGQAEKNMSLSQSVDGLIAAITSLS